MITNFNFADLKSYCIKKIINPEIDIKLKHKLQLEKVLFELLVYYKKAELEKFSVGGFLFNFNKKPFLKFINSRIIWCISFKGYIKSQIPITLHFEKHFYDNNTEYFFVESSGIFPKINYGYNENLGREEIKNYHKFINKFMNSIFKK
jgi:hypothetical protein